MCVDLHTHSIYSDGTESPKELVELAVSANIHALAITDHDTMEGCREAQTAGKQYDIHIVPGLEVSCIHGPFSLHILGYGIDPEDDTLVEKLQLLQDGRRERNRKILSRLAELGIEIPEHELLTSSVCGQAGRPHIARLLVEKNIVNGMDHAFRLYLAKGKPAYAERFSFSAAETIEFIHDAGGVAVLAHPGALDPAMRIQPRLIRELVQRKLDGLEVYHPTHSKKTQKKLRNLADRYNLLQTGGSDYHGGNRRSEGLAGGKENICPPDCIMEDLYARIHSFSTP